MTSSEEAIWDEPTICLSIDVEWAHPDVLADLVRLLDERQLRATFFVTHANVTVPGHERGLHPNFRHSGDVAAAANAATSVSGRYEQIVGRFKQFAPEARGVRSHSLHYDSLLLPIYRDHGIKYDSTYQIPLISGLKPFWKEYDIVEIPIYFNDFFELKSRSSGFDPDALGLGTPGLKVIDIHPNTTYINATSLGHYEETRPWYRDPERLLAARSSGRGIRTFVVDLLDTIAAGHFRIATLGEVNDQWRELKPYPFA